jgi:hypothetical protein
MLIDKMLNRHLSVFSRKSLAKIKQAKKELTGNMGVMQEKVMLKSF